MWRDLYKLLVLIVVAKVGAAEKPLVTFDPHWQEIFRTESMRMTCNVRTSHSVNTIYTWYKNNKQIHTGQTYRIKEAAHSDNGNYQCKGSNTDISDPVTLRVSNDYVILQAPLYIHEGDDLTLRCHHNPGYWAGHSVFYKDGKIIRGFGPVSELRMRNISLQTDGRYSCLKDLGGNYRGDVTISVRELFTTPKIRAPSDLVTEGDSMTLECQTNVSTFKLVPDLLFAFYRDGEMVQGFASSAQYGLQHAQLEHSGKYHCDVKTSNDRVTKSSQALHMAIVELFSTPEIGILQELLKDGDRMTLTCNTTLNGLQGNGTELKFAFYKDGKKVRDFTSSQHFNIPAARRWEHSGNYSCEVRTLDNGVKKRSEELNIEIEENNYLLIILPVTLGALLLLVVILVVLYKYCQRRIAINKQEPLTEAGPGLEEHTEEPYTNLESHSFSRAPSGFREHTQDLEISYADLDIHRMSQNAPLRRDTENVKGVVYSAVQPSRIKLDITSSRLDESESIYQNT